MYVNTCVRPGNAGSQSASKFWGRAVALGAGSCEALIEGRKVGTISVSPEWLSCASSDTGIADVVGASWEPDKFVVLREA